MWVKATPLKMWMLYLGYFRLIFHAIWWFFTSNSIKHGDLMKEIGCYKATPQRTWMKRATEILLNYLSKLFEGCYI